MSYLLFPYPTLLPTWGKFRHGESINMAVHLSWCRFNANDVGFHLFSEIFATFFPFPQICHIDLHPSELCQHHSHLDFEVNPLPHYWHLLIGQGFLDVLASETISARSFTLRSFSLASPRIYLITSASVNVVTCIVRIFKESPIYNCYMSKLKFSARMLHFC